MKVYLQYPIDIDCGLNCGYCFHTPHKQSYVKEPIRVTPQEYILWRDACLPNAEEIVVHFAGGEPFYGRNLDRIAQFLTSTDKEQIDLLSNGLGDPTTVSLFLNLFRDRINRIGFTYHRAVLSGHQWVRYVRNVLRAVKILGKDRVYVKELLHPESEQVILRAAALWASHGVNFKLQDFRGTAGTDAPELTLGQIRLIDPEYRHNGQFCTCRQGYRTLIIRGGCWDGDVMACWQVDRRVGNIRDLELFDADVVIDEAGKRHINGTPHDQRR
jgi:hypothetical protein